MPAQKQNLLINVLKYKGTKYICVCVCVCVCVYIYIYTHTHL